jgi:hypothetical protein
MQKIFLIPHVLLIFVQHLKDFYLGFFTYLLLGN